MKENDFSLKKKKKGGGSGARGKQYPTETITNVDYKMFLANTPAQAA